MAVSITKKFWAHDAPTPAWKDLAKVVFTSPHIDSPAPAGTRSHILPGSTYIGTWYEAVDFMNRKKDDQDTPTNAISFFLEFTLISGTLDLNTAVSGTTIDIELLCRSTETRLEDLKKSLGTRTYDTDHWDEIDPPSAQYPRFIYSRNNYVDFYLGNISYLGTTTFSGLSYNRYRCVEIYDGSGTATITGSLGSFDSSPKLYYVRDAYNKHYDIVGLDYDIIYDTNAKFDGGSRNVPASSDFFMTLENCIIFEVINGEAYNCRLTAWDDDSHNSTSNKVLDEEHYRVNCAAYKGTDGDKFEPIFKEADSGTYYSTLRQGGQGYYWGYYGWTVDPSCLVYPPKNGKILKGNEFYYGDFDLVHIPTEYTEHGEYLIFQPYLYGMDDTFTAGNYDFVTTLHYQYT